MRALVIVNAASGSAQDSDAIADGVRRRGLDPLTVPIDELDRRAPDLAQEDFGRVIVAGGDGSIGAAAAIAARLGVPLGVVPTGTANDLARAFHLPLEDVEAALDIAATGTEEQRLDLADAGGTPFVNTAAAGLSVDAARRAAPLKERFGAFAYVIGAVRAGATADRLRVQVSADGREVYAGEAWQVFVAGTGAFGGGSSLDDAEPGALDVVVVDGGPRRRLLRRAYGMRSGDLAGQEGVFTGRGRSVVVTGPEEFNVDGEVRAVPRGRFTIGPRVAIIVG